MKLGLQSLVAGTAGITPLLYCLHAAGSAQ